MTNEEKLNYIEGLLNALLADDRTMMCGHTNKVIQKVLNIISIEDTEESKDYGTAYIDGTAIRHPGRGWLAMWYIRRIKEDGQELEPIIHCEPMRPSQKRAIGGMWLYHLISWLQASGARLRAGNIKRLEVRTDLNGATITEAGLGEMADAVIVPYWEWHIQPVETTKLATELRRATIDTLLEEYD